jgi:hypothetical protein
MNYSSCGVAFSMIRSESAGMLYWVHANFSSSEKRKQVLRPSFPHEHNVISAISGNPSEAKLLFGIN